MHKKVVHGKAPRMEEPQQIPDDENNKKVHHSKPIKMICNFCLFSTKSDKVLKNHAFKVHKIRENYRFESNFKTVHGNAEAFPKAVGGQRPDFPRLVLEKCLII